MAILIHETKRVIVQGITGREGLARTRLMKDYGTQVVGGVTPGKAGQDVLGVPVFNTCSEAVQALGGVDMAVGQADPRLALYAELLFGQAHLADSGQVPDPAAFARALTDLMVRT